MTLPTLLTCLHRRRARYARRGRDRPARGPAARSYNKASYDTTGRCKVGYEQDRRLDLGRVGAAHLSYAFDVFLARIRGLKGC